MADLDNIEKKMDIILQNQQELINKMNKMEKTIKRIENDIYLDEGFDFEIVCPYCNNEFIVDMDEDRKEVTCPECENIIELDFTGDTDDDFECGIEGCSGCHGCGHDEDDDM
ncbi:MAG: hypothetical protein IKF17_02790 [Clostridia bacterium]|nr:hypothetical protein [Clostridia bacterium]